MKVSAYITASSNSYAPLVDSGIIAYVDIIAVQMYNNPIPFADPSKYTSSFVNVCNSASLCLLLFLCPFLLSFLPFKFILNLFQGFTVTGCPNCTGVTGLVKVPSPALFLSFFHSHIRRERERRRED